MSLRAGASNGDGFVVTGGRGFAVRWDSLDSAAAELGDAAAAIARSELALYSARLAVVGGACTGSGLAIQYDDESRRLEGLARRIASEAEGTAAAVRRAAAAYAEEESRRASAADGLQNLLLGSDLMPFLLGQLGLGGLSALMRRTDQSPGRTLAVFMRETQRGHIAESGEGDLLVTRSAVAPSSGEPGTFGYALGSLRVAHGQVPLSDGTTVPPSSLLVERFPRADGSVAVMVTVPGTETWGLDDANVFDVEGILDGLAYRDSQVRALIREALADQELGPGDDVVFNCYSQGVIHVLGLLEDPGFRSQYRVAAVTAVAGPVSAFDLPADVPVLSLSNADDIVPAASGRAVEPVGSLVSVRTPSRWGPAATASFPQETVAQAHDLGAYEREAKLLDVSTHPDVAGHAAMVGAALGGAASGGAALRVGAGAAPGGLSAPPALGPPSPSQRERTAYTATDLNARTPQSGRTQ